ncbi:MULTISPECIES: DUF7124 domain-containing protein [Halolamina]|uniref:DUF7124 domain-containing protein n=1 Tax=Halolamina pelagica TaxID=699431 RepID=A0A1I5NRM0_9EURY|nr:MULTISPECIES: hypothetical protein [Halolamina]NHX36440.1 hypothetical protein [Halolamina sp. R1-12]SFP24290.1 hypothetical protein SAMN05216277_102156 [Halolamina pelagica]
MTDRIDLDDVEQPDEENEADQPNPGDWLWRGEGSPDEEPDAPERSVDIGADDFGDEDVATPRIPRENDDRPVGVPVEGGGAGGSAAGSGGSPTGGVPPSDGEGREDATTSEDPANTGDTPSRAWGEAAREQGASAGANDPGGAQPGTPSDGDGPTPSASRTAEGHSRGEEWENAQPVEQSESTPGAASHGSTPTRTAEMTMAFSYRAIRRFENVHAVLADAENWTDYLGIVGDVDATVINKYQRDNVLDLDFFNGSGTGPAERLAAVGPNSMFHAERMVLVGVDEREQAWAEEADWEFMPLETAAAEADWELGEN